MKNPVIDPYAAEDIRQQVDKVLRGLGNPEPPLNLDGVRELLKLDLQYYSTTNTGPLSEYISKMKVGAKQVIRRPTLILDVVRKAGLKALWLPDRKRILIDEGIADIKKRHAEAHEIVHSITPHHAPYLFGDDNSTLRRSCHEKLEAEANYGSGQLLFLRKRFIIEARDFSLSIDSAKRLSRAFGNTITMTLWRMVEEAHDDEAVFAVVSDHPKRPSETFDPKAPCKYFIQSPKFRSQFANVTDSQVFDVIGQYSTFARGGPLGCSDVDFYSVDGEQHRFYMETFFNRHEALTLGVHRGVSPRPVFFSAGMSA